ncbi:MAG: hypothetical protein C4297_05875 [Gemmataceae bacterium]
MDRRLAPVFGCFRLSAVLVQKTKPASRGLLGQIGSGCVVYHALVLLGVWYATATICARGSDSQPADSASPAPRLSDKETLASTWERLQQRWQELGERRSGVAYPPGLALEAQRLYERAHKEKAAGRLVSAVDDLRRALWFLPPSGRDLPGRERVFGHGKLCHSVCILAVSYAADGNWLVTAGADGLVRLWDAWTGDMVTEMRGHRGPVWALAFHPRQPVVASGGEDGSIRLWQVPDGKQVLQLEVQAPVTRLVWHPTGFPKAGISAGDLSHVAAQVWTWKAERSLLLSLTRSTSDGSVALWSIESGQAHVIRRPTGHSGVIHDAAFAQDALLTVSADGTVRVQQLSQPARPQVVLTIREPIYRLTVSGDGKLLAVGTAQGSLHMIHWQGAKRFMTLEGYPGRIAALSFSPNGKVLAVAGNAPGGSVRFWDVATGSYVRLLVSQLADVWDLAFRPDGLELAAVGASPTVRIWQVDLAQEPREIGRHEGPAWALALAADGRRLFTVGQDARLRLWDLGQPQADIAQVAVAAAQTVVAADGRGLYVVGGGADGRVHVWAQSDVTLQRDFPAHKAGLTALALTPGGDRLATAGLDRSVRLWDPNTGQLLHEWSDQPMTPYALAFHPEGKTLLVAGSDSMVRWLDVVSGQVTRQVPAPEPLTALCFLIGGKQWASGSRNGLIRIWDEPSGQILRTLSGHSRAVSALAVSADGRWVASGGADCMVRLWEPTSGRLVHTLRGASDWITGVAFSPQSSLLVASSADGSIRQWAVGYQQWNRDVAHVAQVVALAQCTRAQRLVSADRAGYVCLWDLSTGDKVAQWQAHEHGLSVLACVPGNGTLVTGGQDRRLCLWDVSTQRLLRTIEMQEPAPVALWVTADGNTIFTWHGDRRLLVWDAVQGKLRERWTAGDEPVEAMTMDRDRERVAVAAADGTVRVWRWQDKVLERNLTHGKGIVDLAFVGPTHLAVGQMTGELALWDLERRTVARRWQADSERLLRIAVAPDGQRLATVGAARRLALWNAASGQRLASWTSDVLAVAVTVLPDGRVVTGNADATVYLWTTTR